MRSPARGEAHSHEAVHRGTAEAALYSCTAWAIFGQDTSKKGGLTLEIKLLIVGQHRIWYHMSSTVLVVLRRDVADTFIRHQYGTIGA